MKKLLLLILVLLLTGCQGAITTNPTTQQQTSTTEQNNYIVISYKDSTTNRDGASYSEAAISYYEDTKIDGLEIQDAVKNLANLISDHNQRSYSNLWTDLALTDEDPDNKDNVILFYSGNSIPKTNIGSGSNANKIGYWNREHVWPKSHGFNKDSSPAYTDLHHLRPTDYKINATRGNLDFGNCGSLGRPVYTDSNTLTNCLVSKSYFEPRDEVKGDVARILLYMITRYSNKSSSNEPYLTLSTSTTSSITGIGNGSLGDLDVLLDWHTNDPVDEFEMSRNEKIYEIQGNRNPYIDHPEWADVYLKYLKK